MNSLSANYVDSCYVYHHCKDSVRFVSLMRKPGGHSNLTRANRSPRCNFRRTSRVEVGVGPSPSLPSLAWKVQATCTSSRSNGLTGVIQNRLSFPLLSLSLGFFETFLPKKRPETQTVKMSSVRPSTLRQKKNTNMTPSPLVGLRVS